MTTLVWAGFAVARPYRLVVMMIKLLGADSLVEHLVRPAVFSS
jgi:hypothetical protein